MRKLHALFGMRRRFQASNFRSGILPKRSYRTHGEIDRGDTDLATIRKRSLRRVRSGLTNSAFNFLIVPYLFGQLLAFGRDKAMVLVSDMVLKLGTILKSSLLYAATRELSIC